MNTPSPQKNTRTKIELLRMKDIAIELIDIIKLLSKKQKINTRTVLRHYTNITSDELEALDIKIKTDNLTKK
jgi:hypothetical protein